VVDGFAAQRAIWWHTNLVFRQIAIQITGKCWPELQLGALNLRYQQLGYQLTPPPPSEFILGSSILGGPDVLGP
jgi:hypothetical protein